MNSKGAAELSLLKAHWTLASENNTEQKTNHSKELNLSVKKIKHTPEYGKCYQLLFMNY